CASQSIADGGAKGGAGAPRRPPRRDLGSRRLARHKSITPRSPRPTLPAYYRRAPI
ncbi:MAG: hypothetical protein AVDCRST_MAG88-3324, partial [uncultured Thermomicrobiales bacterium]